MKNKNVLAFFTALSISCHNKSDMQAIVTDSNMSGTINIGSQIEYKEVAQIKRNDIVVFNSPLTGKISCLRVVGMPGEKIEVVKGILFVDGKHFNLPKTSKMIYTVFSKKRSDLDGLMKNYEFKEYSDNYGMVKITKDQLNEITTENIVDSIYLLGFSDDYVYPQIVNVSTSKKFNHYFFGPVFVPRLGDTVNLKDKMLVNGFSPFENNYLVISQPYYFCVGDSFSDAQDSRVIGLIPKNSILGTVS